MIKASKTKRILARLLDYLICFPILFLVMLAGVPGLLAIFEGKGFLTLFSFWNLLDFVRWMMVALIIVCAYFTLVPIIFPGQTLGKKLLKIKVVGKNGEKPTFTTMFVREILGRLLFDFTSFGITLLLSSVLMVSKNHETLHDTLSDTMVIEK